MAIVPVRNELALPARLEEPTGRTAGAGSTHLSERRRGPKAGPQRGEAGRDETDSCDTLWRRLDRTNSPIFAS